MCSTSFVKLGRAQATALGYPGLPIAVVPHPFGTLSRDEIRQVAGTCVEEIAQLLCASVSAQSSVAGRDLPSDERAGLIKVPDDADELNRLFIDRRWGDGLPITAPTAQRVERMLQHTHRGAADIVASVAPAFGAATVERIAINAVLAGCYPEYLPVLIAAVEAVTAPEFSLQGVQVTTNPVAVWLVINGPIAKRLGINSGYGCLGPGTWANATIGRAMRLILQNIGGALPGEMDRSTHGQPGKYTFCCAENEDESPWGPFHVEHGYTPSCSTVTVVNASGTWNMNITSKDAVDVLPMIADTMAFPASSDYVNGGSPWLMLGPEHASILAREGWSKLEVKRRLWEQSRLLASRVRGNDLERLQSGRRADLGEITPHTMVPISSRPENINIIVAGGTGTHSVYVPVSGGSRSVTREIVSVDY